jgi:hypothetical protein
MLRLFWQEIQTVAVALLVAILIWVFADSANVRGNTVSADVQLVSPPGKTLLIEPALLHNVSITFQGSAGQLAEMESLIQHPLRLEVDDVPGSPTQPLDLKGLLPKVITELGVHVTEVVPPRIDKIDIEKLVRCDLPVTIVTESKTVPANTLELAGPPVSSVKQVAVQLPERFLRLVEQKKIELVADLQAQVQHPGASAPALQDNVEQSLEVPLVLTPQWWPVDDDTRGLLLRCKPDPATATITFTPRRNRDKLHCSVPIILGKPPTADERFIVKLAAGSDTIPADIEGPADVIKQVREGKVQVSALLKLKFEDFPVKGDASGSKAILWQMPPEVKVLAPSPEPTVDYTITERRHDTTPAP